MKCPVCGSTERKSIRTAGKCPYCLKGGVEKKKKTKRIYVNVNQKGIVVGKELKKILGE